MINHFKLLFSIMKSKNRYLTVFMLLPLFNTFNKFLTGMERKHCISGQIGKLLSDILRKAPVVIVTENMSLYIFCHNRGEDSKYPVNQIFKGWMVEKLKGTLLLIPDIN